MPFKSFLSGRLSVSLKEIIIFKKCAKVEIRAIERPTMKQTKRTAKMRHTKRERNKQNSKRFQLASDVLIMHSTSGCSWLFTLVLGFNAALYSNPPLPALPPPPPKKKQQQQKDLEKKSRKKKQSYIKPSKRFKVFGFAGFNFILRKRRIVKYVEDGKCRQFAAT